MSTQKHSVEWTLKVGAEGSDQVKALRSELDKVGQIDSFAALKKQTEETSKAWEKATGDVRDLAKQIKASGASTGALSQGLALAKKEAASLKKEFEQQAAALALSKQRTEAAKAAWKAASVEVGILASEIKSVATPTKEMVAALNDAEKRAGGLGAEFERQKASLRDVQAATKSAGQSWKEAAVRASGLEKELSTAKKAQAALVTSFEQSKKSAAGFKTTLDQQNISLQKQRSSLNASGVSTANLSKAQLQAKSRVAALQIEVDKAARRQNALRQVMAATASATEKTTGYVRNLVAAYIGLNAVQMGGQYILQNVRQSEQSVYNLEASLTAANREFGAGIGNMDGWSERLKTLGAELKVYSNSELRNAASRTIDMTKRLGMSVEQMDNVIRIAANLGAGKTDLEGSIERVTAALRGEAESAEFLGLTLNENYVKAQYEAANATGLAWKELSDLEKAQARYNILLQQSSGMNGRAAGSINTLNGAMAFMKATIDNALESNDDLKESIKGMSKELADAAPAIVSFASGLTSLLATVVAIVDAVPEGTGSVLGVGLLTKWLFGATTKVFPSLVAGLSLVPAQIAAIAVAYGAIQNKFAQYAQGKEGTPQWLKDAGDEARGYLSFLNSGNSAAVQSGLAQAVERQRLEKEMLESQIAAQKTAQAGLTDVERAAATERAAIDKDLLELRKTNWDELLKKTKTSLKEAESEEKKYAEKVKALQEERAQVSLSTQEKVRSLLRTQMTDYDAYQDKLREANESMQKAQLALKGGDGELAESWAKKAQEQFAGLNSEIKDGERTLLSAAQANAVAVTGVLDAGKLLEQSILTQEKAAESQRIISEEKKKQAIADIEDIEAAQDRIRTLESEVSVKDLASDKLAGIKDELDKITDKTVTIKVRYDVGPAPEGMAGASSYGGATWYDTPSEYGKAKGGRIPGYFGGGRLPGYSLRDNLLAYIKGRAPIGLAGGEDVTTAPATRVIYNSIPWLMPELNKVRTTADLSRVVAKLQGLRAAGGYAGGGRVVEEYRATLAVGNAQSTMTTRSRDEFEGAKALARELAKLKLVRGEG